MVRKSSGFLAGAAAVLIKDITSEYAVKAVDSLSELPPSPENSTLIAIPYLTYTPAELERLRDYILLGGRLILADDFGHGNQVLEHLGLEVRFSGQTLLDPLVNYRGKYLPLVFISQPDPLTGNTDNVVFNRGTGLTGVSVNDTLALSSPFGFLDNNDDGVWEDNEPIGPLPVFSRHNLGKGQVVLVADPSIFINAMDRFGDNAVFIKNIMDASPVIYIDQSHLTTSDLQHTKSWLRQARSLIANPAGTIILVAVVIVAALQPVWHKRRNHE